MDAVSSAAAAAGRVYEDFKPPHDMVTEPATHTLSVDLSAAGYTKEHIRVQLVHSHGLVVVRGERPIAVNRWSRFRLQHRVPDGCDLKGVHARFEGGVVRVTMPGIKPGPTAKTYEKTGDHAQESDQGEKQDEEELASAGGKDGGRLDHKNDDGGGQEAAPSRGGCRFLVSGRRRKLATTVVGAVLVLFSLGLFVRYSIAP